MSEIGNWHFYECAARIGKTAIMMAWVRDGGVVKMAKTGLQKLKAKKTVIEARIKKLSAVEAVRRRKRDKHVRFLVGAFCLAEAAQNGTLEDLKTRVAQSLKREADQRAVMAFGTDEAGDENGKGSE